MKWAEDAPKKLTEEARQAVKNRTLEMETNAKARVPTDTGHLKRSINTQIKENKKSVIGEVSTNVNYALFVEHGTSKSPAQPFLTPSFVNASKRLEADLKKAMKGIGDK